MTPDSTQRRVATQPDGTGGVATRGSGIPPGFGAPSGRSPSLFEHFRRKAEVALDLLESAVSCHSIPEGRRR
jgi:hypothetical protein